MKLLSPQSSNAKLSKNSAFNARWETSILYLTPANGADPKVNLCPASTPGCREACLYTAGRGQMNSVQVARLNKTKRFLKNRDSFLIDLVADLEYLERKQDRTGIKQAIRLNGTSDLDWENFNVYRNGKLFFNVMSAFPKLQFYDYTKRLARVNQGLPKNYHLTVSESEVNQNVVGRTKANIATVFFGPNLPYYWRGRKVIDGTTHDMRFLDPPGIVVGLIAKGRAKRDDSGFVK